MQYRRSKDARSGDGDLREQHERLTGVVEGNVRILEVVVPTVRDLKRKVDGDEPPPPHQHPGLRLVQGGRAGHGRSKWALEVAAAVLLVAGFTLLGGSVTGPGGRPQNAQAAGTTLPPRAHRPPAAAKARGRGEGSARVGSSAAAAATSSTTTTGPAVQAPVAPVGQQPAAISPAASTPTSTTLSVAQPTSTTLLPVDVPTTTVCVNPKGKPCDPGDALGG